ncbi:hypothetical protein SK128_017163 [Halocaridina rubra]|uniref:Uncharacterized protein n=1 Tax=Halocaridina rubra TaxID=373956 RepID=A0AAN8ZYE9_HALRR
MLGNLSSMSSGALHHTCSSTTYIEMQDVNGHWRKVVAFLDTGAETTLVKLSTMKCFGLAGDPFTFTFGISGGDIIKEPGLKGGFDPRGLWKHGIVDTAYPGKVELIRKATIRTVEDVRVSQKERPMHTLCLIATVEKL